MPTDGGGLKASLLGATMRLDGRIQATYAGFPLWYSGDTRLGEVRARAARPSAPDSIWSARSAASS